MGECLGSNVYLKPIIMTRMEATSFNERVDWHFEKRTQGESVQVLRILWREEASDDLESQAGQRAIRKTLASDTSSN